jgi:hypothetical protein
MADGDAIRDTGETVTDLLRAGIPPWVVPPEQILLANYAQLAHLPRLDQSTVSVFLYQAEVRYELRDRSQSRGLPLRLSYVVTPWSMDVADEHRLLGLAFQVIDAAATVPPAFRRGGAWEDTDLVQLAIEQPAREVQVQLWDAMRLPLRPSVYFQANVFELRGTAFPGADSC